MSRRHALIALAVLSLGLMLYLGSLDEEMRDAGGPGIVTFEFAWTEERADEIASEWGEEGQGSARASLWVDFLYLAAYGAFLFLATGATRDLARRRGWSRLAALGRVAVPLAVVAPVCDAIEDLNLLITLDGNGSDVAPLLAGIFASVKFAASGAAIAYVLAGLVMRLAGRRAAAPAR